MPSGPDGTPTFGKCDSLMAIPSCGGKSEGRKCAGHVRFLLFTFLNMGAEFFFLQHRVYSTYFENNWCCDLCSRCGWCDDGIWSSCSCGDRCGRARCTCRCDSCCNCGHGEKRSLCQNFFCQNSQTLFESSCKNEIVPPLAKRLSSFREHPTIPGRGSEYGI